MSQASTHDPWRFTVAAYAWLINVSGNVTAHNRTIDTSASFVDLVRESDSLLATMAYFEATKAWAGVYVDFIFTKLGFGTAHANYYNTAAVRVTTNTSTALTYQMFIVEPGGVFELFRYRTATGTTTMLDGSAGIRYWNNSIAATFDATGNVEAPSLGIQRSFGLAVARSDTIQWVDPVIGLRLRHKLSPHQELSFRGDIGGFGLGSQFTWQALGTYSYNWQVENGSSIAAFMGFRALGVNYLSTAGRNNAIGIREVFYGPLLSAAYRF